MAPTDAQPPALSLLTQNIRYHDESTLPGQADHWPERAPVLARLLGEADADVVGLQEVLASQIPVIDEVLAPTHLRASVGVLPARRRACSRS